jgi:hypothetical protein
MAAITKMLYSPTTLAAARHHPEAKNTAMAAKFGDEIYKIRQWAESQPGLARQIIKHPKRVWGGAHRLNARYLLEGGLSARSLAAYWRAFWADPAYTLKHWHRIGYAVLSLLGLGNLRRLFGRRYNTT